MLPETYWKKNGIIYGVRSRYIKPGVWLYEFNTFRNLKKALEWKSKKEYGYTRELLSKDRAKALGMKFDK